MIPITAEYIITLISIIIIASITVMGILVYFNNRSSLVNRLFFAFTIFTVIWIASTILTVWFTDYEWKTFSGRIAFASASLIVFYMYHFAYHFPVKNNFQERLAPAFILGFGISLASLFTPWMLVKIEMSPDGFGRSIYGGGYYVFAIYFAGFAILSFYSLYSKMRFLDKFQVIQTKLILFGAATTSTLAFITNLILPRLINSLYITIFGPLMIIFFLIPAIYAILKHHIFNLKVVSSELLTFIILTFILLRVIVSNSFEEFIGGLLLLVVVSFFGILLVRSIIKEVSQREKVEKLAEDMKVVNKKFEGLDIARREFLSFASHQLKTPMTVIKGYATLAADPNYLNSPERVKQIVTKIGESTDQMYRLISNFLDARAIEEGKITYIFKPTDIVKLTSSIVEYLIPYAAQKGLILTFNSSQPSLIVNVDEIKFRQVIQNLIDNAIKYTEKGWVKINLEKLGSHLLVIVADSGIGVSSDIKEFLFGEFVRDKSATLKAQGTGLGLYIAREIIKAHQGEIWVESDGEGKGSKFIIKLPLI